MLVADGRGDPATRADSYRLMRLLWEQAGLGWGEVGFVRPRRGLAFTAATTVVARLVAPLLVAHDFWIEPSAFRVEAGSRIGVALRVGERFEGDPVPRNPSRIRKLVLVGGAGATDVAGREGDDPAGTVVVPVSGLHVIGYHSKHSSVTHSRVFASGGR